MHKVMAAVVKHVDWNIVKCLVLAGPGFVKDDFKKHMEEEAVRQDIRCGVQTHSTHSVRRC